MYSTQEGPVDCELISVSPHTDERGSLCFAEGEKEIPFSIERLFWIYDVQPGAERGGHAHRECSEAVFAVQGGFDIYVDDGRFHHTYTIGYVNDYDTFLKQVRCK